MTLYSDLGVDKTATQEQIKKAYRKKAKKTHPDVAAGGDSSEFHKVAKAYNVLMNPETRRRYDETGEEQSTKDPDTPQQKARSKLAGILQKEMINAFQGEYQNNGTYPDIVKNARESVKAARFELQNKEKKITSIMEYFEGVKKRLTYLSGKEGDEGCLGIGIVNQQLKLVEKEFTIIQQERELLDLVEKELKKYRFRDDGVRERYKKMTTNPLRGMFGDIKITVGP